MKYNDYICEIKKLKEMKNQILNGLDQKTIDLINHSNIGEDIGIDKKLVESLKLDCANFDSIANLRQDYIHNQFDTGNARQEITRLNDILVSIKNTISEILKGVK